jgi:hypothetical protein
MGGPGISFAKLAREAHHKVRQTDIKHRLRKEQESHA